MSNPRNTAAASAPVAGKVVDPSTWKTMSLGSLSLKGEDGKLLREGAASFTINDRNAQVIRDAADYILANPQEKVTISAGTFFADANISENVKKFFSHRLYISAETLTKMGKSIADYVKLDK